MILHQKQMKKTIQNTKNILSILNIQNMKQHVLQFGVQDQISLVSFPLFLMGKAKPPVSKGDWDLNHGALLKLMMLMNTSGVNGEFVEIHALILVCIY